MKEQVCEAYVSLPVIVGLFHAISQKLPAFSDWETRKHGQLLNNNAAVCEAMTEMRAHVSKHGKTTSTPLHLISPSSFPTPP